MGAAASGGATPSRQQQQHASVPLTVVWQLVLQPGIIHNVQQLGFCYLGEVHAAVAHCEGLISVPPAGWSEALVGIAALGVPFFVVMVEGRGPVKGHSVPFPNLAVIGS